MTKPHSRPFTELGTAGGGVVGAVDAAAGVQLCDRSWRLEWWVGAEDAWHRPEVSPNLRQTLIESSPVVESRMRVPGGDIIHRAFAFQAPDRPMLGVDVENDSSVPVVLAVVISGAEQVTVVDDRVMIDGVDALRFPTAPAQVAAATDVLAVIEAGDAVDLDDGVDVPIPEGDRAVALLFPFTHASTHRLVVVDGGELPTSVPTAAAVAAGWATQADRGLRLATPDERWGQGFEAARRRLLLELGHPSANAERDPVALAEVVGTLDTLGWHGEARELLLGTLDGQDPRTGRLDLAERVSTPDASTNSAATNSAATGTAAVAWALAHHLALAPDAEFREAVTPMLAGALQFVADRQPRAWHRLRRSGLVDGDLGASVWALAAFRDGGRVLAEAGERSAALTAARFLDRVREPVQAALATGDHPAARRHAERLALVPVDVHAVEERVAAAIRDASPTWQWAGDGDEATDRSLIDDVRTVVIAEHQGIDLLPGFPDRWLGQAIEVHDAPTRLGVVSFALRWHGTRPALLWELEPHDDRVAVELRAPALDADWSTTDASGEALLAERPGPAPGDSFG